MKSGMPRKALHHSMQLSSTRYLCKIMETAGSEGQSQVLQPNARAMHPPMRAQAKSCDREYCLKEMPEIRKEFILGAD